MKKFLLTAIASGLVAVAGLANAATLTVAATPVPHGDILRLVEPDLKAQGIDLKIVEIGEFDDIKINVQKAQGIDLYIVEF
ncbi:MAG: MetQ/NlpA family ABC transporter substrate-binding protein, partial [Sutterellaceae bacterium]|nr:MetQ/NlpA family ABC transporter substrate-binding protein [Sutterellaceae bacterium]